MRLWLNVRNVLLGLSLATGVGVIVTSVSAGMTSWRSVIARGLEAALVCAPLALPLLRHATVFFLLLFKDAV